MSVPIPSGEQDLTIQNTPYDAIWYQLGYDKNRACFSHGTYPGCCEAMCDNGYRCQRQAIFKALVQKVENDMAHFVGGRVPVIASTSFVRMPVANAAIDLCLVHATLLYGASYVKSIVDPTWRKVAKPFVTAGLTAAASLINPVLPALIPQATSQLSGIVSGALGEGWESLRSSGADILSGRLTSPPSKQIPSSSSSPSSSSPTSPVSDQLGLYPLMPFGGRGSGRKKCVAATATGRRCKNAAAAGHRYCHKHSGM